MKHSKILLTAILVLCTVLCLSACGGETDGADNSTQGSVAESGQSVNSTPESKAESVVESETESQIAAEAAFKVKVVDENGNPVAGVMVQVCKDTCIPAKTGDDGIASFNIEVTDGYKLSVLSCPEGYEYTGEAEVYLESGATEITVELTSGN